MSTSSQAGSLADSATVRPAGSLRVVKVVARIAIADGALFRGGWRWGVAGDESGADSVITEMSVTVDHRECLVPRSVYADLADPTSIKISRTVRGFEIVICGGQEATYYRARTQWRGGLVRERWVRGAAFPDEAWEHTLYGWVPLDGR